VFAAGVMLITILALIKRKDAISLHFLRFSITVCGWGFIFPLWTSGDFSKETTLWLAKSGYLFVLAAPSAWIQFVYAFIEKKEPFRGFFLGNYFLSLILIATLPGTYMFQGLHPTRFVLYAPVPGMFHHLHIVHFCMLAAFGLIQLTKTYVSSSGLRRTQLFCFLIATTIGFIGAGLIYFPFYGVNVPPFTTVILPLYPILTGISLIKYGLFDTDKMITAFQKEKLAAIGTLAASINHEIKNPLYVIYGIGDSFLADLREGSYGEGSEISNKAVDMATKVTTQAARALEIMRKFSAFAKREVSEKPVIDLVSIKDAVENVLPLVRHELALDGIKMAADIPDDVPLIKADFRHLEEILFNLFVNACQALKSEGGGNIRVAAYKQRAKVSLSIDDDGPGIPKSELAKIFDAFYTTKSEGTGLGLYITKQLVERNNGKIRVRSKEGVGTSFVLEFPR
jgi:signal transduction histidine kinase